MAATAATAAAEGAALSTESEERERERDFSYCSVKRVARSGGRRRRRRGSPWSARAHVRVCACVPRFEAHAHKPILSVTSASVRSAIFLKSVKFERSDQQHIRRK